MISARPLFFLHGMPESPPGFGLFARKGWSRFAVLFSQPSGAFDRRAAGLPAVFRLPLQNGKPSEKWSVPRGSPRRRFRLYPYSSRTGPMMLFQRIPPPAEYRASLAG